MPKYLTEQQVTDLLNTPDVEIPLELRDKAMLELLYATGLRVTELVTLTIENMNLQQGVVRVIGKGKQRNASYQWEKKPRFGCDNSYFTVALFCLMDKVQM